ncbi:cellulase family glycosylhydrolase [uncultured Fibrobacter sp.]|jgi:Endoglucanase|uniref:glycoside hydrolase family 5 protein n=1 Tax=uncultured Fibrobacter sp. TaxID=261512 RepID=UPI0026134455|nr:cellulase family glycosylhydrolase [uncultured Fibrobacter sp.]
MKKSLLFLFAISAIVSISTSLIACDSSTPPAAAVSDPGDNNTGRKVVPVDYSKGRAMNARLGKGINLGNSWDGDNRNCLDDCWSNPIEDGDFKIIKEAGFNSIRLPVRWQRNSNYETHTVDPEILAGVKEDVTLAINEGLVVLLDFHHYVELNSFGGGAHRGKSDTIALFQAEKEHFVRLWSQIATEFNAFPDSMIAFDILNEPTIPNKDLVNDVLLSAYEAIRAAAPGKTIMFESFLAAKFAELAILKLPADGNIIYSGHYYEPYTFSHQGHGYDCKGDAAYANKAASDFMGFAKLGMQLYPDVSGTDFIPMNVGEFGIAGQTNWSCGKDAPSDEAKARWAKETVAAAQKYNMSFHYWGFTYVGGFEAYDRKGKAWYPGFPNALIQ